MAGNLSVLAVGRAAVAATTSTVPGVPITDDDERLHPVGDPSPHWRDSLSFRATDPGSGTSVATRITISPNVGRATAALVVERDGTTVHRYEHELHELPPADWDVMEVGALTYRMLQAGRAWAVQLHDGSAQAHLEWHGTADAEPVSTAAGGHYEQRCRVQGDLVLDGQRLAIDGSGDRDHTWGLGAPVETSALSSSTGAEREGS